MPRVPPSARRAAALATRDCTLVENQAITVIRPILKQVTGLIPLVWEERNKPARFHAALTVATRPIGEALMAAMAAAHLRGRLRVITRAAQNKALALDAIHDALDYFQKRLNLTDAQVRRVVELYGKPAATVTAGANDMLEAKVATAIQETLAAGEHVEGGVERVKAAFEAAGVAPNNSFTFEAIVRTSVAQAYQAGRWNALQEPDLQEILWGFLFTTAGDDRVRPEHQVFDGACGPKEDPFWSGHWPPLGWGCRCGIIEMYDPQPITIPEFYEDADEGFGDVGAFQLDGLLVEQ